MALQTLKIKAIDGKRGMDVDEAYAAIRLAMDQGFTRMGRTRVGFRGQIIEMNFEKPEEQDE